MKRKLLRIKMYRKVLRKYRELIKKYDKISEIKKERAILANKLKLAKQQANEIEKEIIVLKKERGV